MALGLTQPLPEVNARNLAGGGGKGRPSREAHMLIAVCELSRKCGSLDGSQPCGPLLPVTAMALPLFLPEQLSAFRIGLRRALPRVCSLKVCESAA